MNFNIGASTVLALTFKLHEFFHTTLQDEVEAVDMRLEHGATSAS